jgi:hypothetical protein
MSQPLNEAGFGGFGGFLHQFSCKPDRKKNLFFRIKDFAPLYRLLAPFLDLNFISRDINVKK